MTHTYALRAPVHAQLPKSAYTDDHPHTCKTPALAEAPPFKQKIYTFQNVKKSHIYETVYLVSYKYLVISTLYFSFKKVNFFL